jgi:UDP-2,4-diacetamido-2,4,6-trideoxy-beta-L-altropyranose hydrolase
VIEVAIRTDASVQIGWGHTMRCLALADELRANGMSVLFICRELPGSLILPIKACGHELAMLSTPAQEFLPEPGGPAHAEWLEVPWQQDAADTLAALEGRAPHWLIIDHYGIDARWHRKLRSRCSKLMVIDDLADRQLDCDLLLDQTFCREEQAYRSIVPENCRFSVGSKYALLRPEFAKLRPKALGRRQNFQCIRRILVFMGSTDPENLTGEVLAALATEESLQEQVIDLVLGGSAPFISQVQEQAANHRLEVNVLVDVDNIAEVMTDADLAIGAGGASSWERCVLGLPSLITIFADNQRTAANALHRDGAVLVWDSTESLKRAVRVMIESPEMWRNMSRTAAKVCDGLGCRRVTDELGRHVVD